MVPIVLSVQRLSAVCPLFDNWKADWNQEGKASPREVKTWDTHRELYGKGQKAYILVRRDLETRWCTRRCQSFFPHPNAMVAVTAAWHGARRCVDRWVWGLMVAWVGVMLGAAHLLQAWRGLRPARPFRDAQGYLCRDWLGYNCSLAQSAWDYEPHEMGALHRQCAADCASGAHASELRAGLVCGHLGRRRALARRGAPGADAALSWAHAVASSSAYVDALWRNGGCGRADRDWSRLAATLQRLNAAPASADAVADTHAGVEIQLQDDRRFVTEEGDGCEDLAGVWDELEDEAPEDRVAAAVDLLDEELPPGAALSCPTALLALDTTRTPGLATVWVAANSSGGGGGGGGGGGDNGDLWQTLAVADLLGARSLERMRALEHEEAAAAAAAEPWLWWLLSHPGAGFVYGWLFSSWMCVGFAYVVSRAGCVGLDLSAARLHGLRLRARHPAAWAELLEDCSMGFAAVLCRGIEQQELHARARRSVAIDTHVGPADATRVATVPMSLAHRITSLNLAHNQLRTLPAGLAALVSLRSLNVDGNQLAALPAAIGTLKDLVHLACRGNALERLPRELGGLALLRVLAADDNRLRHLPASIGRCTALRSLSLRRNQLQGLPGSLLELRGCLAALFVTGNAALAALPGSSGAAAGQSPVAVFASNMPALLTLHVDARLLSARPTPRRAAAAATAAARPALKYFAVQWPGDAFGFGGFGGGGTLPVSITSLQASRAPGAGSGAVPLAFPGAPASPRGPLPLPLHRTLTRLTLDNVGLTSLPAGVRHMRALALLSVEDNALASVPCELGSLHATLKALRLKGNPLTSLPDALGRLSLLQFTVNAAVVSSLQDPTLQSAEGLAVVAHLRGKIYSSPWSLGMHRSQVYTAAAGVSLWCTALCGQRGKHLPYLPHEIWLHIFGMLPGNVFLPPRSTQTPHPRTCTHAAPSYA